MVKQITGSLPSRQRRYTLTRLLELAPSATEVNIDLSKFTYDAARAGVVPPLGACVMATRRVVSDQPRNWSQESSESQEEVVAYTGRGVMQPARQPTVPPGAEEINAHKDKGFARFLEKHSSPTHQRVTTGGRIVPMEQRQRPPVFSLPVSSNGAGDLRKDSPKQPQSPHILAPIQKEMTNRVSPEVGMKATEVALPSVSMRSEATDNYPTGNGLDPNFVFPAAQFVPNAVSAQSPTFPLIQPVPLFPGLSLDGYAVQPAPSFPMAGFPFGQGTSTYPGPLGTPYHPSLYSYGDPYGIPCPMPMADGQAALMYCQHMLLAAKATFEELDKQLKSIDRLRATINHDINVTNQRMAIVTQRADVKKEITYWEEKLAFEQNNQAATRHHATQQGSPLNVQAESYVPLKSAPATATKPLSAAIMVDSKSERCDASTNTHQPTTKVRRRAIPIVAPPKASPPTTRKTGKGAESCFSSPASDPGVDEWGVRIGRPPPHIERRQSEMLAAIIRAQSDSPDEPVGSSVIASTSQASSKSSSFNQQAVAVIPEPISENDSETIDWLPVKPGNAPASVEAYYELQLDAMRLPQGVVSKVRLPDGTYHEVPGRGLQRPPSFNMDDFERRYWTSKPVVTKEMADQFVHVERSAEGKAFDQMASGMKGISIESATHIENTGQTVSSHSSHSARQQQGSFEPARHDFAMSNGFDHAKYKPADNPSTTANAGLFSGKQSFGPNSNIWDQASVQADWPTQDQTMKDWESFQDAQVNKGYSSVSVQNVHAMAHLPPLLDGTTDGQKFSAKSLLSAAGKIRSPTLIHRPSPSGGAWFGPHSREVHGHANQGEGGAFRTQI